MGRFTEITRRLNDYLIFTGGVFFLGMIFLTCANILLRSVWLPISGTFELMGFFGAMTISLAMGQTQIRRGHIAVDILVARFSEKSRRKLTAVNCLACFLFCGILAWELAAKGANLRATGELTETLRISYYPFLYGVAFGTGALSLVFLSDLLAAVLGKEEGRQ
jgi:TRAP-type C4-dicarboxylate transport system permease small subunit